jgi:hypothetical protein
VSDLNHGISLGTKDGLSDMRGGMVIMYLKTLNVALDSHTPKDERRSCGRVLHSIAGDWKHGSHRPMERHPLLGDWIRAALRQRIDGVS